MIIRKVANNAQIKKFKIQIISLNANVLLGILPLN